MTIKHIESLRDIPGGQVRSIALCLSCIYPEAKRPAAWVRTRSRMIRFIGDADDTLLNKAALVHRAKDHDTIDHHDAGKIGIVRTTIADLSPSDGALTEELVSEIEEAYDLDSHHS